MADEKFGDLSKVNVYGAGEDKLQALQKTQEDAIKALERRFEQPNWLNVSAAFAKPQLGGFGASWGSAMGEMGKTEEQRRESQLPIAEMRAKLAQTNLLLGSKQKAAEIAERARKENRTMTPAELEEISNLDPERGQQLIQGQDARAKTIANNREITIQNAKARGLPIPVMNEMGLPETGKFPTGGGPQGGQDPARVMPNAGTTPIAGDAATNNPAGPPEEVPPAKPTERVVLKTPGSDFSVLNPSESTIAGNERLYKTLDDEGAKHLQELTHLASTANHAKTIRPIKDVLRYSDDPRFNTVMGIMSGNGMLSGLGALIENGLHVSAADFNASLAVPLSKIALAIKDPKEQAFAQNVYRAFAQMELNNQRSIGLNPSSARNAEFGLLSNAAAHPDTLPAAARLYAKQSELTQLRNKDLYDDAQSLIAGKHKKYKIDEMSPTKMYLVQTSPSQQKIAEQYDKALAAELEKYLTATGGGQ